MMVVYGLVNLDVDPDKVRYVGRTSQPIDIRVRDHCIEARQNKLGRKVDWIRSVLDAGQHIGYVVLATASSVEEMNALERQFIAALRLTCDLMNVMDGGQGYKPGHTVSDISRERMRVSHLGKKQTEAAKRKLGQAVLGRILTDAHKAKIGNANRGQKRASPSAETLVKRGIAISAAKKGVPQSEAHRQANIAAASRPEVRALRRETQNRRWARHHERLKFAVLCEEWT